MDKLIRQSWWKALAVLILIYVFVVGLLVPLKPNITTVKLDSGSVAMASKVAVLEVTGYNTHFQTAGNELRAWLLYEQTATLPATDIEVLNEQLAKVTFQLPAQNPDEKAIVSTSLVMDSPIDGFFVRPSAITISAENPGQDTLASTLGSWELEPPKGCTPWKK